MISDLFESLVIWPYLLMSLVIWPYLLMLTNHWWSDLTWCSQYECSGFHTEKREGGHTRIPSPRPSFQLPPEIWSHNCLTRVNYRVYNKVQAKTVVAKVKVNPDKYFSLVCLTSQMLIEVITIDLTWHQNFPHLKLINHEHARPENEATFCMHLHFPTPGKILPVIKDHDNSYY